MNVYFQPWIGDNYGSSYPRILIIGDSHYCGVENCKFCGVRGNKPIEEFGACSNFTKDRIIEYINFRKGIGKKEDWMTKTFLRFDKIFYGKEDISVEESVQLWKSVAYYIFVQTALSADPSNTNYSGEDYGNSSSMAMEIIKELKPDLVIVWGNRAYESLSDEGWHNGIINGSGYYDLDSDHKAYCIKINHPSRAIVSDWNNTLSDFMGAVLE